MGMRHDWRDALSAYTNKVLIVHGEQDLQELAVAQDYQQSFPQAELKVIAGAGHFSHYSHPEQTAEIITQYLAED